MRFFAKVLLCLYICLCDGAPPRDVKQPIYTKYTDEEDAFIVKEMSEFSEHHIPIYGEKMWKEIAQKMKEEWQRGTPGFPKERTNLGVRERFTKVLIHNYPHIKVKVPESLMQRFHNPLSPENRGGKKRLYNAEEDKLFVEELLKSPCNKLLVSSTLKAIKAEHDKRRRAGTYGFQFERTIQSIRTRLHVMKLTGQFPDEVMKKFNICQEGASSSTSTNTNQQTDAQIDDMVEELLNNTIYEIDFSKFD